MKLTRLFIICFIAVAVLTIFVSCNTVSENNIAGETSMQLYTAESVSTPSVENSAALIPSADTMVTPKATPHVEDTATTATFTPVTASQIAGTMLEPTVTATKKPTATVKPTVTNLPTKKPSPTKTPAATKKPTATPAKNVYVTIEFEGKTYNVLMGRNGNPYLIKDYSTLPEVLQPYAYPLFDMEAIRRDLTLYAKSIGFNDFYNPNLPLRMESTIRDAVFTYPEAFVPGGPMTSELAWEEFSWGIPANYTYSGDDDHGPDALNANEVEEIIGIREIYRWMIDNIAEWNTSQNWDDGFGNPREPEMCLAIWFEYCGDSAYRSEYIGNGLYNGKPTKEYAVYFMYGGAMDLLQDYDV